MNARDRLFAAARHIHESQGLEALTIRAVGQRAGLSAMAIYRHFPDKDALIDALMADGLSAWEAIVARVQVEDPIVWLQRVLKAYRDFALQQPHRFDVAFLSPAPHARTFPADISAGRSPVINRMMETIGRAQADGRMTDDAPLEIAMMLAAMAQGLVSMHRAGRFGSDAQFRANYQLAMDRLLAGFSKAPGAARATAKSKRGNRK